jgi:hypothetical protein
MQVGGSPSHRDVLLDSVVLSFPCIVSLRPSVKPPPKRTLECGKTPAGSSAPVRSDRSLDETSHLLRQSPWRRCCCVGLPGPTAAVCRWGPPPPPPAVEPRSSTPRLPPPLYETENCLLLPPFHLPVFVSSVPSHC